MTDKALTTAPSIAVTPPQGAGLDFEQLLDQAVSITQALSGKIWTDYNEHDPGVTILEQLCYALTELAYRANYPVADLLVGPRDETVDLRAQSLYQARAIFPTAPVTIDDFRRIIIDRVAEIGNVWLTPIKAADAGGVNGLYDIAVYAPGADPCGCDGRRSTDEVRDAVRGVYSRYRALCEDMADVRMLEPVGATVAAVVSLDGERDSALILADMLFAIGMLFAPEPKRQSLAEAMAASETPADIFDGPLLRNGFISDDQLTPLPTSLAVAEVLRAMAPVDGVVAVSDLSVAIGPGHTRFALGTTIPIPAWAILSLTNGGKDIGPIKMYRNGVVCSPNPAKVRRQLDRLWAAQRRTWRLGVEYPRYFPVPEGTWFDPTSYYSVQNQFPNVYGISSYGLPAHASPMRRGQAKQLKGYLLAFEQLLADYFSQLGKLRVLYSANDLSGPTYFYQSLRRSVPNVEPLLASGYETGLAALVASQDPAQQRHDRFLSYLLALYAEDLSAPPSADCDCGQDQDSRLGPLIAAKRALLHQLVPATRDRGRGFDYLRSRPAFAHTGMEIKTRIQLGLIEAQEVEGDDWDQVSITEDSAEATFGRLLGEVASTEMERGFIPVDPSQLPADDGAGSPFDGHVVGESLLRAAQSLDNFRLGVLPRERLVSLICRSGDENRCWHLGRYASLEECFAALARLFAAASRLLALSRRLYVVEHTLLRWAGPVPDGESFEYSFTVTAVLSASLLGDGGHALREDIVAAVRENAPAHVMVEFCFLPQRAMRRFRRLRRSWLDTLRHDDPRLRAELCADMRDFLIAHGEDSAP